MGCQSGCSAIANLIVFAGSIKRILKTVSRVALQFSEMFSIRSSSAFLAKSSANHTTSLPGDDRRTHRYAGSKLALSNLNFDHLKDREPALIKDLGRKRGSLYWLRGWDVFEQIKRPLLKSRGFCFSLPSRSALKIWGDGVSNDGR
jgi:hypothetical protein